MSVSDLGVTQLKNILDPIRVYSIEVGVAPQVQSSKRSGLASFPEEASAHFALPDKASIAVLPFQNMSGDAEQEYFADGMVEDIITALSRFKNLFVIARNSTFTYKGRAVDIKQVGRELVVRYVLEGSVRKATNRVRITGQLIDTATGAHLWADRFEGALEDIFDLQDRVAASVVGAITPKLEQVEIERARRKHPERLDAYDHYLRALPHVWTNNPAEAPQAIEHLEAALQIQPDFPSARAFASWARLLRYGRESRDSADRITAIEYARSVLQSGTDDATALAFAAFTIALLERDYRISLGALARAVSLNPNSAIVLGLCATVNAFAGQYDVALEFADKAIRYSPLDPWRHNPYMARGFAHLSAGRHDDAISAFHNASEAAPRFGVAQVFLAAAYSLCGSDDEARAAVLRLLELEPNYCIRNIGAVNPVPPEKMEAIRAALRKAGLPE